ncbi:MAG: hypothetical protein WC277_07555 [Bacilli bacterium]
MPPKGWSTAKLRAATLKRLERLRSVFVGGDRGEEKKLSYDDTINLLIDEYYQKRISS